MLVAGDRAARGAGDQNEKSQEVSHEQISNATVHTLGACECKRRVARGLDLTSADGTGAIQRLERGDPSAWEKLWQELHHQGDVGEAVPELVRVHRMRGVPDWNTYALVATVEEARHSGRNPAVPDWLLPDYEAAWRVLETLALAEFPAADSGELIQSIVAVLAFKKGRITLGRVPLLTEDERQEMLDATGWG